MFAGLRHFRRIITVARVLARHDALFPLDRAGLPKIVPILLRIVLLAPRKSEFRRMRPGEQLTLAMTALGPAFVKLGQALSVRPDLVGDTLANDLTTLQDNLPAFSGVAARATIETELNGKINELFDSFDDTAIAAASIAQVHKAKTPDGDAVAVKILRPGIEAAFARDLDLALWAAQRVQNMRPDMRRLRPVDAVRTIIRSVEIEMDLRFEAAAADELRQNFEDDPTFSVPAVDWLRTGRRVMTTAWIDATPMNKIDRNAKGFDRETIVANFAQAFFLQVFRDGFFHADLHP
ncbi:MAG: ABC1 kinase family protein, partial [Alphaproteobacteria bacterium]